MLCCELVIDGLVCIPYRMYRNSCREQGCTADYKLFGSLTIRNLDFTL